MLRLVRVAGDSMSPTFRPSDLLLTARVGRAGAGPRRGDVVVLRHGGRRMVKRVAGVPGDVVELEAGRLRVNGAAPDGQPGVPGAYTRTWRVPPAGYFVTGDNGRGSDDSRVWAEPFVAASDVEARVVRRLALRLRRPRPVAAGRPGR